MTSTYTDNSITIQPASTNNSNSEYWQRIPLSCSYKDYTYSEVFGNNQPQECDVKKKFNNRSHHKFKDNNERWHSKND